jgi:hypothetical protein
MTLDPLTEPLFSAVDEGFGVNNGTGFLFFSDTLP